MADAVLSKAAITVSVVIPAFNAVASLERALLSVCGQTLRSIEIIVVDDASTDGTAGLAVAAAARDARIRVEMQPSNRGVSAARNAGIDAARGDWVAILDADDAFVPERLERLVAVGRSHGAQVVADDILYYDWHEQQVVGAGIGRDDGSVDEVTASELLSHSLPGSGRFEYSLLKVLYRTDFLRTSGVRYIEGLRQGEDFMMYAHSVLAGAKMVLLHRALYLYTETIGRTSRKSSELSRTIEDCVEMRRQTLTLLGYRGVRSDPKLSGLIHERAAAIRWYASWDRLYRLLRDRRLVPAAMVALTDWRAATLLVREVARRALRRSSASPMRGDVRPWS